MKFSGLGIERFVAWMNILPPELVWLGLMLVCFGGILVVMKLFGQVGLYMYIVVAVIAANIQVLKAVQFAVFDRPVALGTILFASTYLCTDILTEFYGAKAARKGVYLGFAGMVLMVIFMIITLGFRPVEEEAMQWAADNHNHMMALFLPTPALLIAGMVAYLSSQLYDVWVFNFIKRLTKGRFLWIRNNGSTIISAFIDNVIFSVLAWIVLAEEPLAWSVVWGTYILGTYGLRVIVAVLDTPVIYLAKYCVEDKKNLSS